MSDTGFCGPNYDVLSANSVATIALPSSQFCSNLKVRFYQFATPLLSHRVRICRFLTENIVTLRAFLLANFEISNSYSFGSEVAYDLLVFAPFRSTKTMKKTETSIKLLTLAEAASILKISKRTLHRMIQNRQIPAFKVGGQWRILESRFQEWVQEEENTTPKAG